MPQKRSESENPSQIKSNKKSTSGNNATPIKPKIEVKPTFSTFKQFNRTASLSDLINEDDNEAIVVIPSKSSIIKKLESKRQVPHRANNFHQLDTASVASFDVNVPEPILPPTKSITVQTDEVDLSLVVAEAASTKINKSDPLRISTEPLNIVKDQQSSNGIDASLSTSFDSMDDTKSKSTDVSMEDALQNDPIGSNHGLNDPMIDPMGSNLGLNDPMTGYQVGINDDEEDLPTPPATPPLEERLKSPVSTTSRSPPSPTQTMTPTKKVTRCGRIPCHKKLYLEARAQFI